MEIVCLDLEGVLVPEIWISFAEKTGIKELRITTREESDYNKLMAYRINILRENGLKLQDIQAVIDKIEPLEGAGDFVSELREITQFVILSDTFKEFAQPIMRKLGFPTIFCNSLVVSADNMITGFNMRAENGKKKAVDALKGLGFRTFASGDSYNDLEMIKRADAGCLFRPPENILRQEQGIPFVNDYPALLDKVKEFINEK